MGIDRTVNGTQTLNGLCLLLLFMISGRQDLNLTALGLTERGMKKLKIQNG